MLKVLVADDDPTSRTLVSKLMNRWGYRVITAEDGTKAWEILSDTTQTPPDIAILDWFMPGFTGPEITEKHAALENATFIYKIILSGHMAKENIIEALHRGAHDVLEKPCDAQLLQSRLKSAKKIIDEKRAITEMAQVMERYAVQMEQLANERARQLVHAERMSGLGVMAAGVAHEINNPMSFISGNVQNIQLFWKDLSLLTVARRDLTPDEHEKLQFIHEEMPKMLEGIMKGVRRVTTIVKGLKRYSGQQSANHHQLIEVNECVHQAVEMCRSSIGKEVKIQLDLQEEIEKIMGNALEIEQVLINLMVNAAHAMEHSAHKEITIRTMTQESAACIQVEDCGTGIPEEHLKKIWSPFFTTKAVGKGTGLGLSISSGIVRNHNGTISATNKPSGGTCMEIRLPIAERGEESVL